MGCTCSSSNLPDWRQQIDAMLASYAVPGLLQLFKRVVPKATSVKKSVSANVIRESIKEYFSGTNASSDTVDFVRYVHRLSPVAYEPFRRAASQKEFLALGKAFLADDDKVRSLEAMVARQLETAAKMLKAAEGLDVKKAVQDYVRFLLLFRRVPRGTVLVPTLLQDLVWHAHMRYPLEYARATVRLCGFFLDHSDEIPEENLAVQRRVTADAMSSLNRTVTEASNTDNTTTMLVPATYAPCAGMLPPVPGATCGGAVTQGDDHHHHHAACGGTTTHHTTCGDNTGSVCGGGGHHSSCGGGGGSHHHSSCGGGHHSSCGGHHSSCGGATTSTCGGATTSTCGGAISSCGGATASSCGGATSSCGGGGTTSSCGGATSSCGGATSSCGGSS